MKIGAVQSPDNVNAVYRVLLPMMAMQERGHEIVQVFQRRGVPLDVEPLLDCDVVHIHRLLLVDDQDDCIDRLRAAGVPIVLDDDDDSAAAPPEVAALVAPGTYDLGRRDFERLLARAGSFDLVTAPSDWIADRFEAAGAPMTEVIDNFLPAAFSRVRPQGHEGFVIGWHGCIEHRLDAEALGIAETLAEVLERHPDVRVVTIGGVDLAIDHERYVHEPTVSFDRLTQRLADFDLGLVPLADIPFCRGRSNVKAREYAAAGVPWLASPVGSYSHLGREEGGVLVDDGDWAAALDELIGAGRERRKLAKHAKAWAERETIGKMAGVWEQTFADAIGDATSIA